MILNPADPPVMMRNTVYCLVDGDCDHRAIDAAIRQMVGSGRAPTSRATASNRRSSSRRSADDNPLTSPRPASSSAPGSPCMLEVTGAAHYLPAYAGNLDIMTSAALATAERIAIHEQLETTGAQR